MKKLTFLIACIAFANEAPVCPEVDNDFYQQFWQISATTDFAPEITKKTTDDEIFRDILIKSLTGFGTMVNNNQAEDDPLSNIMDYFSCYLPESVCNKVKDKSGLEEIINELNTTKNMLSKVEQCYANIKGNKAHLGNRKRTQLEQKLELYCNIDDIDRLLGSNDLKTALPAYKNNFVKTGPKGKVIALAKAELENIHLLLLEKIKLDKEIMVTKINKKYLDNNSISALSFIDNTKISNNVNEIFDAFTNMNKIDTNGFPLTVFSREPQIDDDDIIISGSIKKDLSQQDKESVLKYRSVKKQEIARLNQEYATLAKSFGILKQAAISGLTTIISERFAENNSESKLSAIENKIQAGITGDNTIQKPSAILKSIRDNVNLNNKINFMRYLALEKTQLAITSTQMSQLQKLADKINETMRSMNIIAAQIDAGDEFTSKIGQKPDISEIK